MKLKSIFTCFIVLAVFCLSTQAHSVFDDKEPSPNPIQIKIYYETLNPVVRKFFLEQLKPVWNHLNKHFQLSLIPYGRTEYNGTQPDKYSCFFNADQCLANKAQACVISLETDKTMLVKENSTVDFAYCFFKNRNGHNDILKLTNECLESDDDFNIKECMKTDNITDSMRTLSDPVKNELKSNGLAIFVKNDSIDNPALTFIPTVCGSLDDLKNHPLCQGKTQEKVNVKIYYESLDSNIGRYIQKQLKPYYHVLEDMINLDLIPYGNTQLTNDNKFQCSKGEQQCFSNKLQSMLVDKYITNENGGDIVSGPNRVVNFIDCVFGNNAIVSYDILEKCANLNFNNDEYLNFLDKIKHDDEEVIKVFTSMKEKTDKLEINGTKSFPLVVIDDQVDAQAFNDLVSSVCAKYNSVLRPSICTKVNVTLVYEPLDHASRSFFLEQIKPVFNNLQNLIDLTLLPSGHALFVPSLGFQCRNGDDQCLEIKYQVCAIDNFWNNGQNNYTFVRQEVIDFIICTFKNINMLPVKKSVETCSQQYLDKEAYSVLENCVQDNVDGILYELIETAHSIISNLDNKTVPIVLVNGNVLEDLSKLPLTICSKYDNDHLPDYCNNADIPKIPISVYYESKGDLVKNFFTTQMDPWYEVIEELVDINLVPGGNEFNSTCDINDANSICFANRIQAVIIDIYYKNHNKGDYVDGTYRTMKYLSCVFDHPQSTSNVFRAAEDCAEDTLPNDVWFDLFTTVLSEVGQNKYENFIDQTKKFKEEHQIDSFDILPWVTLDYKHSKRAANDLLQTVCNEYQGDKPLECVPVHVDIYYAGINSKTRRFVIEELLPTFHRLRERIQLNLIPYGVLSNDTVDQECDNNDKLCLANKIHACAISKYFKDDIDDESNVVWDGKLETLSFIHCMFKNITNMNLLELSEHCGNDNFVLSDEINTCAEQQEGKELLKQNRQKTHALFDPFVHSPHIVINGQHNVEAETNLLKAICDNMEGYKPNICNSGKPAKVNAQIHYSALDSKSMEYITNKMYSNYRELEEIVDIDIVPFGLTEILKNDNGNYTFICPNGQDECIANLIHACVLNKSLSDDKPITDDQNEFDGKLQSIEFVNCYFKNSNYPSDVVTAASQCVESIFGDAWGTIRNCAFNSEGSDIMVGIQDNIVANLLPHITYVPWVIVNDKHNYAAENHLRRITCDLYQGKNKPPVCSQNAEEQSKPVVEIHYEPLNKESKNFFTIQLNSSRSHIENLGQIKFVPFGRSSKKDGKFNCVGDAECHVYKQHSCVLKEFAPNDNNPENMQKILNFLACTFTKIDNENGANECFNEAEIGDWSEVEACALQVGDKELENSLASVQNLNPKISYVPWILINDEHNLEAENNLASEICKSYYPDDKPENCIPKMLPVDIYYETYDDNVNNFMVEQLASYSEYLDWMGDFSFVPYGLTKMSKAFECRNPDQCKANIFQACVIDKYYNKQSLYDQNRIRTVGFLICTAMSPVNSSLQAAKQCFQQDFGQDKLSEIDDCATGVLGEQLYKQLAQQTASLTPPLSKVPWVTISKANSPEATKNLFEVVCNAYDIIKPPLCSTLPSPAVKVKIYFSSNKKGQDYLVNQLLPFYKEIVPSLEQTEFDNDQNSLPPSSLIEPELIAWGDTVYTSNQSSPFECSTKDECFVNRLLACADNYHSTEPRGRLHLIEFTLCLFQHSNFSTSPENAANQCADKVFALDPYPQIHECATKNDKEFVDIFLKMKTKTEANSPELKSFPAVTVDNVLNQEASSNLLKVVCNKYKGSKLPAICSDTGTTTENVIDSTTPGDGDGSMSVTVSFMLLLFTTLVTCLWL